MALDGEKFRQLLEESFWCVGEAGPVRNATQGFEKRSLMQSQCKFYSAGTIEWRNPFGVTTDGRFIVFQTMRFP